MEGSVANQGEAENCRDLAKSFMAKGEYAKASRFFEKSLRLFPLPGVKALMEKADLLASQPAPSSSSSSSSSSRAGHGSANSSSNSNGNANSSGGANGRPYTPEQEAQAKKVLAYSKKSHYQVLGLERSASSADIKKAYRKLALRLHPDKCSAPSAEAAFKAVSTAFDTLSDAPKRDLYDQVGHDNAEEQMRQGGGMGGGGGGGMHGFRGFHTHGNMHEVSPEDLFNMFFSGQGSRGRGFRPQQRQPQQQQQQQGQGDTQQGSFFTLFQLLPVLLMLFMSLSSFSSPSSPAFSLYPQGVMQSPRHTHLTGISQNIKVPPLFPPPSNG
ncbi:DnaJ domain-containing protein [Ochromonadaceae sp. CCMP2298]|nr:DnaJ domain-containing protein [Ochromonadaceae sp. CCMP2298]